MVKISELPFDVRRAMVTCISVIMTEYYNIDMESVEEFWDTVGIGIEVKKRV